MSKFTRQKSGWTRAQYIFVAAALAALFGLVLSVSDFVFACDCNEHGNSGTTTTLALASSTPRRDQAPQSKSSNVVYAPGKIEQFVMNNLSQLGYKTEEGKFASGCKLWNKDQKSLPIYDDLHGFRKALVNYAKQVQSFAAIGDLRKEGVEENPGVCEKTELHPEGFFGVGQLSLTKAGFVEPLVPPMRHPDFCVKNKPYYLLNVAYLVHDWTEMCRQLKRTSRIVLFDLGASFQFSGDSSAAPTRLMETYAKFGLPFDHIYAYEITELKPRDVYKGIPDSVLHAYHWFNVPVSAEVGHRNNPLTLLKEHYDKDDLIVVKLDIDTSSIELQLAQQIVEDPVLSELVDQLYFEQHVHMREMKLLWEGTMKGSIADAMQLFTSMRQKGIAAHFWV